MVETVVDVDNEEYNSSGEQPSTSGDGKTQPANKKGNTAQSSKDVRRKKDDALEGKHESHKDHAEESDESGHGHSEKGGDSENSGSHSQQQSLQSGQTTVQFSSGGGMGANVSSALNSLMGLFASSASLVRAEGGSFANLSIQTTNLTLRIVGSAGSIFAGVTLGEQNKEGGLALTIGTQTSELSTSNLNLSIASTALSHSSGSSLNTISSLLHTISTNATDSSGSQGSIPTLTTYNIPPTVYSIIPTFNVGSLFINTPDVFFALPNSTQPYTGLINLYVNQAGLPTSTNYTYQFIPSPLPSGVTLTPSGDLTVNVTSPASFLVDVNLGSTILPVRIDVGPGNLLTDTSTTTPFIGNSNGAYTNGTVMRVSGNEEVIGNVTTYNSPTSLASNVIYRHYFTDTNNDITTIKPATNPVMGNFETGNITIPTQATPATFTLGGNVLDVFGTQYGIGQTLTINLNTTPTAITFAGNTLAGFGTYYGDYDTLNLNAQTSAPPGALQTINFGSNQIYVDKAFGRYYLS